MDSLMQDDEYTNYYASLMQQMQKAGSSPASSEDSGERNGSSGGSPASSDDLEKQYHHHHTGLSPAESNGDYLYEAMGTHNVSYDADDDSEEEEEMVELPHHRLMISSPTAAAAVATTAKKRKTRAKRDPNKPKGFLPAILLYSNANRPRVKEENPTATFGEVARLLSAEYNALSPEDVAFWQQKAADDKERYEREMLSYVPPPPSPPSPPVAQVVSGCTNANDSDESGSEEDDTMVVQQAAAPKAKKAKKAKKDPNAPKHNRSAWQFFSSGNARKIIKSRNPEAGPNDVCRILGQHWRALSETERAPLQRMADADKLRFKREMEAYQLTKASNDQEE